MFFDELIRKIVEIIDEDRKCGLDYLIESEVSSVIEEIKDREYNLGYEEAEREAEIKISDLEYTVEDLEGEIENLKEKIEDLEKQLEDKNE